MKTKDVLIGVTFGLAVLAAQPGRAADVIRYNAQPTGSKVKIEGTSTIHDWSMESVLVGGLMEVDAAFPESALTNADAAKPSIQVLIPVRSLKSEHTKMDEVMQEHMNVTKFPRIEYRLIELKPRSSAGASGAVQFDALGALTISGTVKTNTMSVTIQRVGDGKLKVIGSTPLKMTDFGVKPPAPSILGMPVIKTGDDIKITFEWLTVRKTQ